MSQSTNNESGKYAGTTRTGLVIYVAVMFALSCASERVGPGNVCETASDCRDGLQCLNNICTPQCSSHLECGDGFICDNGSCSQVVSQIGQACTRELDCGPGQTCEPDMFDGDGDGRLAATCQLDQVGAVTGSECVEDDDCRNGVCAIGRCTEVCAGAADCPLNLACVDIPRVLPNSAPTFRGCFQASGNLVVEVPMHGPAQTLRVPVPSNAKSFALITQTDDESQPVGADEVVSPSGRVLYKTPNDTAQFYQNDLRYEPGLRVSTLLIPNVADVRDSSIDDLKLEQGVYTIKVQSFRTATTIGSVIPKVTLVYKLDTAGTLDLNFYFLDANDHPCYVLDSNTAQHSNDFQVQYLDRLRSIFSGVMAIGDVTYQDVSRPDLDGIDESHLPQLIELSTTDSGVNVFFVRTISPPGIQALAGGRPGPPNTAGTTASGIAISLDTLCYRDWNMLARTTAHEIGRHLGLFRNKQPAPDPTGQYPDTIPDSSSDSQNLMYFGEFGGTVLSEGQKRVLRLYPGLR